MSQVPGRRCTPPIVGVRRCSSRPAPVRAVMRQEPCATMRSSSQDTACPALVLPVGTSEMMKLLTGTKGRSLSTSTMRIRPRSSECSCKGMNLRPWLGIAENALLLAPALAPTCIRHSAIASGKSLQHAWRSTGTSGIGSWRGSRRLRRLTQLEFLDLAGRGLGQLGEHHAARAFEAGELLLAIGDDISLGHL